MSESLSECVNLSHKKLAGFMRSHPKLSYDKEDLAGGLRITQYQIRENIPLLGSYCYNLYKHFTTSN